MELINALTISASTMLVHVLLIAHAAASSEMLNISLDADLIKRIP
jgi:hypothetical protein